MAEEKPAARVEVEAEGASVVKDVEEEKTAIVPASEKKPDDFKALAIVEREIHISFGLLSFSFGSLQKESFCWSIDWYFVHEISCGKKKKKKFSS